ncbi:MAG TPA: hypothetical protein VJM33_14645 [Microthrixaceae bacterium]|nr:hypothetical protein [Microthrixaceae bacterium]
MPVPTRTPPTVITDLPSDLQLETPGFGTNQNSMDQPFPTITDDNSKLLFRTEGQSVVPGGFFGDEALVMRDRTTGTNTLVASSKDRDDSYFPKTAHFLPNGNVVFPEHGYWLPLAPDEPYINSFFDVFQTQIYEWDAETHDYTVLSLGLDGKPIASVPFGVHPQPGDLAPTHGPRNPEVSADGRYVFFTTAVRVDPAETQSPLTDYKDLFRRDTVTGEIVQVNVGNYDEFGINANRARSGVEKYEVSADGQYVMFITHATGGLAETGHCGQAELVFLRDIDAETTALVSHDNLGKQRFTGPGYVPVTGSYPGTMSADGRYVIWQTMDLGMPNLPAHTSVIWDRLTGQNDWILPGANGTPTRDWLLSATADMSKVLTFIADEGPSANGLIPGDGDGDGEGVLFDRSANTVRKVSQLPDGTAIPSGTMLEATLSPDGSRVFFVSPDALLPGDTHPGRDLYSMAL